MSAITTTGAILTLADAIEARRERAVRELASAQCDGDERQIIDRRATLAVFTQASAELRVVQPWFHRETLWRFARHIVCRIECTQPRTSDHWLEQMSERKCAEWIGWLLD